MKSGLSKACSSSLPICQAVDIRTGAVVAVFEPWWSDWSRVPCRFIVKGRMRGATIINRKHLKGIVPFSGKEQDTRKILKAACADTPSAYTGD